MRCLDAGSKRRLFEVRQLRRHERVQLRSEGFITHLRVREEYRTLRRFKFKLTLKSLLRHCEFQVREEASHWQMLKI